jgi:hypothetical protein
MKIHKCDKCDKIFAKRSNLIRHYNKKIPCVIDHDNICIYCDKKLSSKQRLDSHLQTCRSNKIYNKLAKDIDKLKNQHNTINNNCNNNCYNTNSNNTYNTNSNNTNNINFYITPFGHEDQSKITKEVFDNILEKAKNDRLFIYYLIDSMHFNEQLPENHNIFIPDKNRNFCVTFDGNDWFTENYVENETIKDLIFRYRAIIEDKISEYSEMIPDNLQKSLLRHLDNVFDENGKLYNILNDKVKSLCYSKNHMPIKRKTEFTKNRDQL